MYSGSRPLRRCGELQMSREKKTKSQISQDEDYCTYGHRCFTQIDTEKKEEVHERQVSTMALFCSTICPNSPNSPNSHGSDIIFQEENRSGPSCGKAVSSPPQGL